MPLPNPSMSFTPFDILTAEELNDFVENDQALAAGTGFNTGAIPTAALANGSVNRSKVDFTTSGGIWWEELGRTTLSSTSSNINVTLSASRTNLRVIIFTIPTGGTISNRITINNLGTGYSRRRSENGGAESTAVSDGSMSAQTPVAGTFFTTADIIALPTQEKLFTAMTISNNANGAGNIPLRVTEAGKLANTSSAVTSIQVGSGGTGQYAAGSYMVVLGHD